MTSSETHRTQTNTMHLDIELTSAYIDSEVTPSEAAHIEHHLQECRRCNGELASLRWTVNLLREVPPVPVPRSFVVRQADIEPEPARQPFTLPNWLVNGLPWATAVTAVLVVLTFSADIFFDSWLANAPAAMEAPMARSAREESAPLAAEAPAAESETAPRAPATAAKERTTPVELAEGPPEQPAPADSERATIQLESEPQAAQPKAGSQKETVPSATTQPQAASEQSEDQVQALAAPEPTQVPQTAEREAAANFFRAPVRALEIGLTSLLIVLLILSLWARRQHLA
ncbi:MAG: hypothetical protein MAG451_03022 [Anaerolineales bacterium]|nr:hypothetical protein [Anaerolineales bacterium]